MKFGLALLVAACAVLAGCSGAGKVPSQRPREIRMWVAPNEAEESFWKVAVAKWNKSGLGMPVSFTTIPTTGSSEDAVLSSLIAGTEPDISSNMFSGFAVQIADLKQLQPLSAMPGYQALVTGRHMQELIRNWTVNGKVYAIPIYSNPTLIWWRSDILARYGVHQVPKTYQDVYQFSRRYANAEHRYGFQVSAGNNWEDRWFDFIAYYYAASGGQPYIANGKAVFDNAAGQKAAMFMDTMYRTGWTAQDFDSEEPLVSGLVAGASHGPWDIGRFESMYPETMKRIAIGPMLTDATSHAQTATFADSKGIVLFKSSKVKNEAFAFIAWVLGNDQLNLLWLEKTGMMPARADLLTNPVFKPYFSSHPIARIYANYVNVAVPPALNENTIDIQKAMSVQLVGALALGTKTPQIAVADAVRQTDRILQAHQ
ncbi:MAG: ABC transporter substrate-binding protein [Pseudomonadota bacterium]|nr:ABC transporter substrate-binding protein [Pseudomonadota bacterium]